jgi:osmotically inducible protein OsmC
MPISTGRATWEGSVELGQGTANAMSSIIFSDAPITWASRAEEPEGHTSPEELLAVAQASCVAMQLAHLLNRGGTPPRALEVVTSVNFDQNDEGSAMPNSVNPGQWSITGSDIVVTGSVPGLDQTSFARLVDLAKDASPISRALKGNVKISARAKLVEQE